MIRDLSISTKLLMVFVLSYLLLVGLLGWIVYNRFHQALQHYTFSSLSALREVKKTQIEYYFTRLRVETMTMAQNPVSRVAAGQLVAAYQGLKDDLKVSEQQLTTYKESVKNYFEKEFIKKLNAHVIEDHKPEEYMPVDPTALILQYLYIASNPNPTGSKSFLNMANDGSVYSLLHGKFQDLLKEIIKRFSFHDMYIVDPQTGNIVYTVYKDVDFATNLKTGPYRNTNLAKVYNECVETNNKDSIRFADFESYPPAYGAAVAFIGAPVYDAEKKVAVVIFQLRIDDINDFMTENFHWDKLGLGATGELYLVGSDYKMRSVSRLFVEDPARYLHILESQGVNKKIIDQMRVNKTTILLQEVNTLPVKDFLRGQTATSIDSNYLNKKVLSSYSPLNIPDISWGIVVEKQYDEVFAPIFTMLYRGGIVLLLLLFLLLLTLYSCMKYFLTPINVFIKRLQGIATDPTINLSQHISSAREDEMGYLTVALNNALYRLQHIMTDIKQEYQALNNFLNTHTKTDKAISSALQEFTQHMSGIEKTAEEVITDIRQAERKRNQCYEVVYAIKNSLTSFMGPLSTINVGNKKVYEALTQARTMLQTLSSHLAQELNTHQEMNQLIKTLNSKDDAVVQMNEVLKNRITPVQEMNNSCSFLINTTNEIGTSSLTIEQANAALTQQIAVLNQQVQDIEKLLNLFAQSSSEEAVTALQTDIQDAQRTSQELKTSLSTIATITNKIKKVNEEFGKILDTFVS